MSVLVHEPNNRLIREYSHVLAEHAQLLTGEMETANLRPTRGLADSRLVALPLHADYNTPPKAAEAQNPEG